MDHAHESVDLIKIGAFARLAGTNLRTLRYYEELGILAPAARSRGGFRYYRQTDLHRLEMIRGLQSLGLQLERIAELMCAPETGQESHSAFIGRVRAALEEQETLLREKVRELESQRRSVRGALSKLGECSNCQHHPGDDNNHCHPCALTGESLPPMLSALF